MEEKENIFGCFVSITNPFPNASQNEKHLAIEQGKVFRSYIWGDKGIDNVLKPLNNENYGNDLKLVLFQFYVNPIPYMLQHLRAMESYRKKEKSMGMCIIVTDENFFNKSEADRYRFLKEAIMQKMDLLAEVVKKKKLDTNMKQLKVDLEKILGSASD